MAIGKALEERLYNAHAREWLRCAVWRFRQGRVSRLLVGRFSGMRAVHAMRKAWNTRPVDITTRIYRDTIRVCRRGKQNRSRIKSSTLGELALGKFKVR